MKYLDTFENLERLPELRILYVPSNHVNDVSRNRGEGTQPREG